jgi:hypothetical protein
VAQGSTVFKQQAEKSLNGQPRPSAVVKMFGGIKELG